MIVGSDYRYMIPVSSLVGALLLLLSDTVGRNIIKRRRNYRWELSLL